jgi:hypothetical protein
MDGPGSEALEEYSGFADSCVTQIPGYTGQFYYARGDEGEPTGGVFHYGVARQTDKAPTLSIPTISLIGGYELTHGSGKVRSEMIKNMGPLTFVNLGGLNNYDRLDEVFRALQPGQRVALVGNRGEFSRIVNGTSLPEGTLQVITCGKEGAMVQLDGEVIANATPTIEDTNIVDTMGAGDAFLAVFLAGFLKENFDMYNRDRMKELLQQSVNFGSRVTTFLGPRPVEAQVYLPY